MSGGIQQRTEQVAEAIAREQGYEWAAMDDRRHEWRERKDEYRRMAEAAIEALALTEERKTRRMEVRGGPELVHMHRLVGPWVPVGGNQ